MLHTLTGRAEGVRLRPFQEPSGRSPIAVYGGGVQGIEAGQDALGAGLVDLLAESRMAVLPALQGALLPSLTQRVYRAMFLRVFERHDHIKLTPPLILTEDQADELIAGLTESLDVVAEQLSA
jgi:acetylornithine/succinyldiaminopimelate/putrescine aminotransferase